MVVSPVLRRLRAVVQELGAFVIRNGDDRQKRFQRILNIIIDESAEELATMDENLLGIWLVHMGKIIEWCGTGDFSNLPPQLVPFAAQVEGIDVEKLIEQMIQEQTEESEEVRQLAQ